MEVSNNLTLEKDGKFLMKFLVGKERELKLDSERSTIKNGILKLSNSMDMTMDSSPRNGHLTTHWPYKHDITPIVILNHIIHFTLKQKLTSIKSIILKNKNIMITF